MRDSEAVLATRRAFDSVAADYDSPLGNNALIQRMRARVMAVIESRAPAGARLLDLGCGTGLDAAYLAARGYHVLAIDWSPQMVARTRERLDALGLNGQARAETIGLHELGQLDCGPFDAAYSNFGPLNCAPDLRAVSRELARRLKPRGVLIASVIGRICPWEIGLYLLRGDLARMRVRFAREAVPVPLGAERIWTRYYAPGELAREFEFEFELVSVRALGLFLPPPYLIGLYERRPALFAPLGWLDDRLGAWPGLRSMGDHFLIVLRRRD